MSSSHQYDVAEIPPPRHRSKRTNRILGDYTLSKTLGAGSMGKVKLATHNVTGELYAVKILPRARNSSPQTPKEASKDASREVRTLREAGLSLLLHHPHVCAMYELIVHPNHYYMVFEYVNGGQLLDFIISHGRLRESIARKFARQIASALAYCHANNVVHRDLKIENILIDHRGDIKIIDFGLSNLYDPASHLSTFCGSLYFAAPELLNAKLYTGPEVDIWSFGVVLYTLVCGKVPFEDESMPALHAKIKRGLAEYPVWLSPECKHLLSRMLVTVPAKRALLTEIMSHPWFLRAPYSAPPETHLPTRVPLRAEDIDPEVVARMAGFEFGRDVEEVVEKLRDVLESDAYAAAVKFYNERKEKEALKALEPAAEDTEPPASPTDAKRRRFSGFDFYRRLFAPSASSSTTASGSTATPQPCPPDPTMGFHPLISIYFLAQEKIARESSRAEQIIHHEVFEAPKVEKQEISRRVADPPAPPEEPLQVVEPEIVPVARPEAPVRTDSAVWLTSSPAAVEAAEPASEASAMDGHDHSVAQTPEPVLETNAAAPVPAPALSEPAPHEPVIQQPESAPAQPKSEPEQPVPEHMSGQVEPEQTQPTQEQTAPAHEKESTDTTVQASLPAEKHEKPSSEKEKGGLLRRFGSIFLGSVRHDEVYSDDKEQEQPVSPTATRRRRRKESKRTSVLFTGTSIVPKPVENAPAVTTPATEFPPEPAFPVQAENDKENSSGPQTSGSVRRRATTILDRRTSHERRRSTAFGEGSTLRDSALGGIATVGRNRRSSVIGYESATMPKKRQVPGTVPEAGWEEEQADLDGQRDETVEREAKPVYLKGLFSVSTTSTKPAPVIKADIRRVLDGMQVRYWQSKTGFECISLPSAPSTLNSPTTQASDSQQQHEFPSSGDQSPAPTQSRRGLSKRVSKLSFSVRRVKSQDRDFPSLKRRNVPRPLSTILYPSNDHQSLVIPDELGGRASLATNATTDGQVPSSAFSFESHLRAIPSDFVPGPVSPTTLGSTGEINREVLESMAAHDSASVRFEINVVKVPLIPLHGIQFRRAGGDGWQYQMLARRVLTELKL
ncbi:unnamed protein product [Mycena citricolor]|uniref:non-specific serine/threonine protein kinase n=1 Tax=Mycena citricolor TaxID=2018698 RepID=A0AAD2K7Y5_9AGAR|nr:unnamed protein product [Mycena citricolor]